MLGFFFAVVFEILPNFDDCIGKVTSKSIGLLSVFIQKNICMKFNLKILQITSYMLPKFLQLAHSQSIK